MRADILAKKKDAERRGRRSEILAAMFLMLKFYRILGRRVRTHAGEIDLIARAPSGLLCFIEVKARGESRMAIEAVGPRQQGRIARAASLYLAGKPSLAAKGVRFDIIAISAGRLPRHFRDAFRADDWRSGAA